MSVVSLSDFLHRATVQFVEECTLNVFTILSPVYVGGCYLVANRVKKFSTFSKTQKKFTQTKVSWSFKYIKFRLSEKHTKFKKIFLVVLTNQLIYLVNVKIMCASQKVRTLQSYKI